MFHNKGALPPLNPVAKKKNLQYGGLIIMLHDTTFTFSKIGYKTLLKLKGWEEAID